MKTKQHTQCNLKINSLVDFKGECIELLPDSNYTLIIDYPLEKAHSVIIKTGKRGLSYTALLKRIGKEYIHVYSLEHQFGVWGHSLNDLYLEQLHVDHETKKITLAVGS